jgi:hypothetical protein
MLARHVDDAAGIGWKPDEIDELVTKAGGGSLRVPLRRREWGSQNAGVCEP